MQARFPPLTAFLISRYPSRTPNAHPDTPRGNMHRFFRILPALVLLCLTAPACTGGASGDKGSGPGQSGSNDQDGGSNDGGNPGGGGGQDGGSQDGGGIVVNPTDPNNVTKD